MVNKNSLNPVFERRSMRNAVYALILMSSLLLGIWAVKDTIALRNILLVLGSLCSIPFLYQFFRSYSVKVIGWNWLPIACLVSALIWVLFHYCFLSTYPKIQLHELNSIWLRATLATIFGLATGVALYARSRYVALLWFSILISFFVLFFQYLPLAYESKNLIVPLNVEDFRRYLYVGKINPMYMGVLLIAGASGLLLDVIYTGEQRWIRRASIFWIISLVISMYSFAFIINTRSGILLGSLIVFSWVLYGLLFHRRSDLILLSPSGFRKVIGALVVALSLVTVFAYQQIQRDSGWKQLVEDIIVGYQVEKYPHWQDVSKYGFPTNESGNLVAFNTYERVAWATAGIKSIPKHPFGVGVLLQPLGIAAKDLFPGVTSISTHSGWVDLTLSFGLPMLGLILVANLSILYFAMRQKSPFRYSIITLSITIFALFLVGELSNSHSLEMVFYLYALMTGAQIAQKSNDVRFA